MANSLEEMIASYIDKYITSEKNRSFIYYALLKELQQGVEDFYELYIGYQEDFLTLEQLLNLSDFECVIDKFSNVYVQADELYIYYNDHSEDSDNLLINLLYIFIKLNECADKLSYIEDRFGTDSSFKSCSDLFETDKLLDTVEMFINKLKETHKKENQIEFVDIIVKTNIFKCNKNHNIEQVQAFVNVIDYWGEVSKKTVSVGYCKECNCYFILERDFEQLKRYGLILCRIISEKIYRSVTVNAFDLQAESLLHQAGYNVSASKNLSAVQRREILKRVVDSELYSINGLCSFLDYLIDKNLRVTTRDMSSAINKWSSDRDFIINYNSEKQRNVNVSSFIETDYEYEDLPF